MRSGLVAGAVDDPVLRATVGLRLALILGDPLLANDTRRAVQVRSLIFAFFNSKAESVVRFLYCMSLALFKKLQQCI